VLKAIWDGQPPRFDAVTVDREGIEAADFFAPWEEVHRVMADGKTLFQSIGNRVAQLGHAAALNRDGSPFRNLGARDLPREDVKSTNACRRRLSDRPKQSDADVTPASV